MQLLHISNSALSLTGSTSDWPEHALIRPSVRTKEISLGPDWPAERGLGSVGAQRCKLGKCHDSKQSTCQKAAKKCCGFPGFLCRKAKEPERDITRRCNIMHVLPLNVPRLKSCRRHGVRLRQHRRRQDCRLLRKYHYARYTQYGLNRALPPIIPRRLQLLYADSYQQTRPQRVSFNFQRNLCPQPHHQRLPTAIPNLKSAPPSGLTWPLDFRSEKKKKAFSLSSSSPRLFLPCVCCDDPREYLSVHLPQLSPSPCDRRRPATNRIACSPDHRLDCTSLRIISLTEVGREGAERGSNNATLTRLCTETPETSAPGRCDSSASFIQVAVPAPQHSLLPVN